MNIVVINASPRKRGNTAQLCKKVVEGAMDNGADVHLVDNAGNTSLMHAIKNKNSNFKVTGNCKPDLPAAASIPV